MSMSSTVSDPLIFQEGLRESLSKLISDESGVRVILLYGASGSGLEELAEEVVCKWMECEKEQIPRLVDFQKIVPLGPSRNLRLEMMKEVPPERKDKTHPFLGIPVQNYFRTRPLMSSHKCIWIKDIDRAGERAANSLLKTLEEMPDYARVIMTTEHLSHVLSTIQSRSICICVSHPSQHEIEAKLGEIEDWKKPFIMTVGDLNEVNENEEIYEILSDTLNLLRSQSPAPALRISETVRDCAKRIAEEKKISMRAAHSEVLAVVGRWLRYQYPQSHEYGILCAEAHKLVQGNANAQYVFDGLFASILTKVGNLQ